MDRLVKPDVKEVELSFKSGQKCSSVFRLTNLMHTMSVAVSLTTTKPALFSFSQPFSVIPPLSSLSYTLLSQPLDQPPLCSAHHHDVITVRSAMLPTGKAHPDDFHRLFSVPGRHVFMDAAMTISFVGPQVVEFLIAHHAKMGPELSSFLGKAISGCSESQLTKSLKLAIESENPDLVSALIDAGAEINGKDSDGRSLLGSAVKAGSVDMVRVLIASGCRVDNSADRVLHDAAAMNRIDLIEILCKSSGNLELNSADSDGRTPVHIAAARGHVEALSFLLSAGGSGEARDSKGWTPLHHSSAAGHHDVVECLLERSNAKYVVDRDGKTAFALAAENGHTELLAPLRVNDALHRAARLGDVNGVKSCLAEGATVNGRDQNGWTPLHRAAFKGGIECARVLLNHGAQVDAVDEAGYTPLHCAVEAGHAPVAMLLIAHGARPGTKNVSVKGGSLPLNVDRFKNHPALVIKPFCHEKERV
ncbi:Notch [Trema orientale]|uniref:Notch n=1 Tax=Trema orientale TaxID=63057 RepID=A0A2P5DYY0_TREOI|nr:Notch [Trema orientale]